MDKTIYMKNILIILLLVCSVTTIAQTKTVNTNKNGFGANGYDLVSYFDGNPIEGSKELMVEHKGVKYLFSSKTNLNKFSEDPEKYLPEYGGWCAYAIGKSNDEVKVNPKSYIIEDGKLYLFYKNIFIDTKKKWNKNEEELHKNADQNWSNRK